MIHFRFPIYLLNDGECSSAMDNIEHLSAISLAFIFSFDIIRKYFNFSARVIYSFNLTLNFSLIFPSGCSENN